MKKMKKALAMILSLAMVLAMSLTAFADQQEGTLPQKKDTVDVKIENLGANATVTLYKIVEAEYGSGDKELKGYDLVSGMETWNNTMAEEEDKVTLEQVIAGGSVTVQKIANAINGGTLSLSEVDPAGQNNNGTYTCNVHAGMYIALISPGTDEKELYNPVLLSAAYSPEASGDTPASTLIGGEVDLRDAYMTGETAVAKKSTPKVEKEITDGTEDDDSASLGDRISFKVTPDVPDYPKGAENKTFFISDKMEIGLDFDYNTLAVKLTAEGKEDITLEPVDNGNVKEFKNGNTVVARAAKLVENSTTVGFRLAFVYDELLLDKDAGNTGTYTPVVTYQGILNESAVVGETGNSNNVTLYYATNPSSGKSHENPTEDPSNWNDVEDDTDMKTVYTYVLAVYKTNEKNEKLPGATFGIYTTYNSATKEVSGLIDTVTTDENGYAVSRQVEAGTYFVKEIAAPDGYTLNTKVYKLEAAMESSKTVTTGSKTVSYYTSDESKAMTPLVQVGWFEGSGESATFHRMSDYSKATDNVKPAYLMSTTTTNTGTTVTETAKGGAITVLKDAETNKEESSIPNTKMSSLPSTGGIGTTIFTIGGCIIMIVAAGLFFASRRKKAEN